MQFNSGEDGKIVQDEEASSSDEEQPEEENDIDEVTGYHFLECTALFTAYLYVNSGKILWEYECISAN